MQDQKGKAMSLSLSLFSLYEITRNESISSCFVLYQYFIDRSILKYFVQALSFGTNFYWKCRII